MVWAWRSLSPPYDNRRKSSFQQRELFVFEGCTEGLQLHLEIAAGLEFVGRGEPEFLRRQRQVEIGPDHDDLCLLAEIVLPSRCVEAVVRSGVFQQLSVAAVGV